MRAKKTLKIMVSLCLLTFMVTCLYNQASSQAKKETAFTGDFKPYFAENRIVIKATTTINKSNLRIIDGTVVTGIKSIDNLNVRYKVNKIIQLFPDSENLVQADELGLQKIYRIEFPPVPDVTEIVISYSNDPNIEYAQPIGIHKVFGITPNDPEFSKQWGLTKIQAPDAWDITQGDTSIILAILDTGVDWLHPDLGGSSPYIQGNIWTNWNEYNGTTGVDDDGNGYIDDIRGWDWVNADTSSYPPWPGEDGTIPDNNPMDFNGHGTHCSGIASGMTDNSVGVAGVGWNCRIMSLRAGWSADYMGYEVGLVDMSYCAQGIYYAARNGAAAVNCSWGSSNTGGIADAVTFATSMGVVVVSSAGNDDLPDASYLCSRHDVISVAATDPDDYKASYSSFGYWVDIAAPGGDSPPITNEIYSTYYDHNTNSHTYEWLRGTSMAAPHVVGLIGLINSQFPGLSWQGKKDRLQFTSVNIDLPNPGYKGGILGEGRINAFSAVNQIDLPSLTTFFTEKFDSGLPTTWIADQFWRDDDPGNKNFEFDDIYEPGTIKVGYDIWSPPFLIVDSDYEGSVPIDASLISPIIDCSMYSNVRLVFNNWFQNYGEGNIEKGDIDIRINNGPWQTVASFVDNNYYNVTDAGKEVMVRLPSSVDYQSNVQIRWHYYNAEWEWFWGIDDIKLVGEMLDQDYYVKIIPSSRTIRGEAGDTLSLMMKVKNIGLLSDSYDLKALDFSWQTTIWDSAGINQIGNTGVLASREEIVIMVKLEIPGSADLGDTDRGRLLAVSTSDTSIYDEAAILAIVTTIGKIPWLEDFPTIEIDTMKWCYNTGPAQVSTLGSNEPSSPYVLNLNGDALGGDEIQSCDIDLSAESSVIVSYYYQRTGGGNSTETGDDLWVDYLNSSGTWVNLKQHLGDGPDMTEFTQETVPLPTDAYHRNFRIRFRNSATAGNYDDWFIDDVFIGEAPDIVVTHNPDPFEFTLDLGDSTTGNIEIGNEGGSSLNYETTVIASGNLIAELSFIDIPAPLPNVGGEAAKFNPPPRTRESIHYAITGESLLNTPVDILLIYADDGATVLQTLLQSYPDINIVDTWLANYEGSIPTLNDIRSYDLVLVWNNYAWADKYAIGNVLADFIDAGGKVISLVDCWSADPYDSHGRYFDAGYCPFASLGGALFDSRSLGWYDPGHPIMQGVSSLAITRFYNNVALTSGAELVATWDDNTPLVGTKPNTVAINVFPGDDYYWTGDFPTLVHNSINYLFVGGPPTWLTLSPTKGIIRPDTSDTVFAKVRAFDLIPDSTYFNDVIIRSNDPDENLLTIPASLTVKPTDFYFMIVPTSQGAKGKAGDTLIYKFNIKNYGRLTDSYGLSTSGNVWNTSFWDTTGSISINNTGPVASKAEVEFIIKVEIPASTKYGDADTAKIKITSTGKPVLSRFTTIQSKSLGIPASIPWSDEFKSTTLDPDNWIYNDGPAEVNGIGIDEPSPPYSLNLDGYATGGDEVHSTLIDLSNDSLAILSYYWQLGGAGDTPEYGDDLWVDYITATGSWVNLKHHPGDGPFDSTYTFEEILLPAEAYHNAFQLRFRSFGTNSSYSSDDWFVDDVKITRSPVIHVEPEKYDVTVIAGDSVKGELPLTINNSGEGTLRYRILSMPSGGPHSILQFEPATRDYPTYYYSMDLEKGEIDPRKGAPVVFNTGGPDKFGYYWIDSDEPGGPAFNWVDISAIGTEFTGLGDDSNVGFFPIGFTFPFYGRSYTMFRFCTNGFISFTSISNEWSNEPIPNQSVYDLIAPFWDDLYFETNSNAYYHFDGEKLIIQFNNVLRNYSEPNTFEILLYPDGTIVFQYLSMLTSSNSATVGIQNFNGSDGLEIAFNTEYIHNRMAIYISTGVPWIQFDHTSGVLATNLTDTVEVEFNAKDINVDKVLYANIVVQSNDPTESSIVIPTRMEIITAEFISGTVLSATNPLENAVAQVWDEYPNGSIIDEDTTKADGKYFLTVPPVGGIYTVRVYANGYVPAFKEGVMGNTANLNFTLKSVVKITPTTEWVDFFSSNSKFWDGPVQIGDVVTAEDTSGVVCGIFTVNKPNYYGFMPVYRDDIYTLDIDEGAEPGDTIIFKINGYQAETLGPDSPVWTRHGEIRNVDLSVAEIDTIKISLPAGWNLVSWYVKTAEDSTHKILEDILSNVIVVLSYENGALVYDPKNPDFSNLRKMDHLRGYWIRMAQTDTLLVIGNPADLIQTSIYGEPGWNLVSYLPKKPDSVAHAFDMVIDNLVRVYGFKNGAKTFDPDKPQFSTLHVLCPTYGYWMYLTQNDTLIYPPEPLTGIHCQEEDPMLLKMLASTGSNWSNLIPTNEWINIFGEGIKLDEELLPIGTWIYAKDPDGVTCGEFVVTTPGKFGFMPIYRDDPKTKIDEGARPGDEISIYFNDFEIPVKVTWKSFGDVIDLTAIITSVAGDLCNLPTEYDLSHNYPNPFNPQTTIKFQLPRSEYVTLKIYNMLGQLVRTLVAEDRKAGYYHVIWDGRDSHGGIAANGIYLYRLKAGDYEKTRKMIMLK